MKYSRTYNLPFFISRQGMKCHLNKTGLCVSCCSNQDFAFLNFIYVSGESFSGKIIHLGAIFWAEVALNFFQPIC